MTGAAALIAFAAASLGVGQYLLPRLEVLRRAPRLGIALWQTVSAAAIAALLLGMVALTMPGLSAAGAIGEVLRACAIEIQHQYASTTGAILTTASGVLLAAVGGRLAIALWGQRRRDLQTQRAHLASLDLVTERAADGVVVLDQDAAAAYCVQGERRAGTSDTVVITRGAMRALTADQIALVLRHEHAHLSSRHARLVARAHALSRAFPYVGFFRVAHQQIALLAEMHADDAVAVDDRRSLAEALYELALANRLPKASGALAATGADVVQRAQRLVGPHQPLRRTAVAFLASAIVLVASAPATLALVPGGVGDEHSCCLDTTGAKVSASPRWLEHRSHTQNAHTQRALRAISRW
ncbi:MAG: M56 family metallopeptidase [Nocardioides sp.]|uniref:M56 family metallopeptidase n=1 Tax=Nocardioides sp. TaxID=35761 RepID=UPI003D6A4FC5